MTMRDRTSLTSETPKLAGVIGWPIEHSLSPVIHTIWAHRASVNGYYIPFAVPATYDDFSKAMDSLQVIGFEGVNVTLPHKEHALRYADEASKVALQAGAANMLTFRESGPYADNSDVSGFSAALAIALKDKPVPDNAVVLGAGGAARGVVLALKEAGVSSVTVANRTKARAARIAKDFNTDLVEWDKRNICVESAGIIVNTTSLGMIGQPPLEIDASEFQADAIVADIVYSPLETLLLKEAKARGCCVFDGLDMLMHQAAPGFRAWFRGEAKVDEALRDELIGELKLRGR